MSFFLNVIKKLNPDEEKLNNLVNNSIIGSTYNLFTRFGSFVKEKLKLNSFIIDNLDNIYFIFLAILIFAIPFATTSTLGILASCLIILTMIKSSFLHKKFEFSALHVPIFFYIAILLISVGFSTLFMPSLKGLLKMIIYFASFFSFFEFLKRNPQKIIPVIVLIAISCSVELLFSLKQMLFGVEELAGWQDKTRVNAENLLNRVFGTLKPYNPNLFASYIMATAPCIFALFFTNLFQKKKSIAIISGIFALLSLVTIIQTGCRGAYIGLFFAGITFLALFFNTFKNNFKKYNYKKILFITLVIIAIIFLLIFVFCPSITHRLTSIFTLRGDSSNSYRMNVYISSLKMLFDNFWIGIGTGNTTYRLIYGLYMITGYDALGAYNIFLEMAIESGVFALLTFLWLMILSFVKSIKKLFKLILEYKIVVIMILTALVGMLAHGFFDTVWYRPQVQLIFWLYMAILAVITMKGGKFEKE